MTSKTLLIAASALALAACGGADVEEDVTVAETEYGETDAGAETLLSAEQPPLEGDSPFVDQQDVADSRLTQRNIDSGFDGPDLTEEGYLNDDFDTAATGYGTNELTDVEPDVDDIGLADSELTDPEPDLDDLGTNLAATGTAAMATGRQAMDDGMDRMERGARDVASTVTDGTTAKQYTANNTDAYIREDGELITGSEAALLAGTWNVDLPDTVTAMGDTTLYIDGRGDEAVGTFAGEPIEVAVTGRNFQFDAPLMMNGERQIMTFTGTFEDGQIENGVIESVGDGRTMDFTAMRTDADTMIGSDDMMDDFETGDDDMVADDPY
jgi:hypothetical protein